MQRLATENNGADYRGHGNSSEVENGEVVALSRLAVAVTLTVNLYQPGRNTFNTIIVVGNAIYISRRRAANGTRGSSLNF